MADTAPLDADPLDADEIDAASPTKAGSPTPGNAQDVENAMTSTVQEAPSSTHERTTAGVGRAFEPAPASDRNGTSTDDTIYGSVDEWLRKYWRFTYRRRVSAKGTGTGRWRAQWWNTDEAVQRLETLWRGWETARLDPGLGTSTWWINHATPHMNALLSADGPFADAKDETNIGDPLPYQRPPKHLFPPDKQPEPGDPPRHAP